jgi:hypothetical protein
MPSGHGSSRVLTVHDQQQAALPHDNGKQTARTVRVQLQGDAIAEQFVHVWLHLDGTDDKAGFSSYAWTFANVRDTFTTTLSGTVVAMVRKAQDFTLAVTQWNDDETVIVVTCNPTVTLPYEISLE